MEYDDVNGVLRCPNCGYTEYLEESDEVKKERIRSKTAKEIEISKKKIEADEKIRRC